MSLSYQTEGDDLPNENLEEIKDAPAAPPLPYYTIALVASIVAVFLAQIGTGFEASVDVTAFDKPVFLAQHEYWRILTGATVHGGLAHVAMNSYAFYSFGCIFEMLSNRAHLAIVFLLSALGGGVLSLIFVPDGSSVGASGGIVGLVSYLAVYAFRRRRFISYEFRKSLLINIGFILVFGLVLFRIIDNFGHIGGLITGAIYGLIQIPADEYIDPRIASPAVEIAGLSALGLYLAACGFSILLILRVI
ncbi:MAG: rhomboid family intramembrane serine protease [Pyrinomonadaceae bacterium]